MAVDTLTQLLQNSLGGGVPSSAPSAQMTNTGFQDVADVIKSMGITFPSSSSDNGGLNIASTPDLLSGSGSSDVSSTDPVSKSIADILNAGQTSSAPNTMVQFNPSDFQVPDINQYVTKAMAQLAPYYQKLITEAGNDVNVAIQRLQQDYQTGTRYNQQDLSTLMTNAGQDVNANLTSSGLQGVQEVNTLLDSLNKRGIALQQGESGQPLQVAQSGQAGTEMGTLHEDQQLRNEAIQRTYARNTQQYQTSAQRNQTQLAQSQTRGTENAQRSYQQTGEQLQQQEEQQALGLGQMSQQQALQQQSLNVQQKQLAAAYGGGKSTTPINSEEQAIAAGYHNLAEYKQKAGMS